ncbi:MAG: hypothetical protein GY724_02310 [Actinomycetia bacterium]|nr:hypothetical protein [Actinomycetes bacterium]MCP4224014.1 hypothetical protein [Actinomycetes bacterium]MCP5031547.1 hypothetical protein [Actinomycetes bacterium]
MSTLHPPTPNGEHGDSRIVALAAILASGFISARYNQTVNQLLIIRARDHLGLTANTVRVIGRAELAGAPGVLATLPVPYSTTVVIR